MFIVHCTGHVLAVYVQIVQGVLAGRVCTVYNVQCDSGRVRTLYVQSVFGRVCLLYIAKVMFWPCMYIVQCTLCFWPCTTRTL